MAKIGALAQRWSLGFRARLRFSSEQAIGCFEAGHGREGPFIVPIGELEAGIAGADDPQSEPARWRGGLWSLE